MKVQAGMKLKSILYEQGWVYLDAPDVTLEEKITGEYVAKWNEANNYWEKDKKVSVYEQTNNYIIKDLGNSEEKREFLPMVCQLLKWSICVRSCKQEIARFLVERYTMN